MFCPSKYSVQFSHSVVSNSLQPHRLQHARLPCPSSAPGAYSNSCPLSRWYHPTISSSVVPFSSHLQSFPSSGSFLMSQFFTSDGQSIGISASASVQILGKELTSCWLWGLVVNSSWVVHWRKVLDSGYKLALWLGLLGILICHVSTHITTKTLVKFQQVSLYS